MSAGKKWWRWERSNNLNKHHWPCRLYTLNTTWYIINTGLLFCLSIYILLNWINIVQHVESAEHACILLPCWMFHLCTNTEWKMIHVTFCYKWLWQFFPNASLNDLLWGLHIMNNERHQQTFILCQANIHQNSFHEILSQRTLYM